MKKIGVAVFIILLLAGCGHNDNKPPIAGVQVLSADRLADFNVPANLVTQGDVLCRVISGEMLSASEGLELSTGANGLTEYFAEVPSINAVRAQLRMQFLSTQGVGRILLSALDSEGKVIKAVGWVMTGAMPINTGVVWQDVRTNANYLGEWIEKDIAMYELFEGLPDAATYRLSIQTGNGQHAVITKLMFVNDNSTAVRIVPQKTSYQAAVGQSINLETSVQNLSGNPITVKIDAIEPYGLGLVVQQKQQLVSLLPFEKKNVVWQVSAKRASTVNLGQPWELGFNVDGKPTSALMKFSVEDTRPGKIFYVMTEDLEPIDSAGYPKAWGNSDGWINAEELQVQMIGKSERLNEIAGQYGAKWTHYIAWPAVRAAEWAAKQSTSADWQQVIANIKASVSQQTELGHEYALHMHTDYDPYLPGNILSYNPQVDGFWGNHLRHGWAHSVLVEGDFDDYDSRNGILFSYQSDIDKLAASSGHGQIINARAGSFDFGNGSEEEAKSTRVYRNIGLWGSSDADGNAGGVTAGAYGREIYFAKPDDINVKANNIKEIGIVEFRPTPQKFIAYDGDSAETLDEKTTQGIMAFTQDGKILPGVHAIVGFTHAMFMMGASDWRDLQGGQFAALDQHLSFIKQNYVDRNLLEFATGSELVRNYLDYYTPNPVGLYGKLLKDTWLYSEFAVDILGQDIVIDNNHPHEITLKYPLYLRPTAYRVEVLKDGKKVYSTWGVPTPFNDICFVADSRATYTMKIYHNSIISALANKYHDIINRWHL